MEIIDNHGFFRIEKDNPLIGKDKIRISRNDKPEKFIELTTDQMTPRYLASRLSQLGIKNVDLSKLDLNKNGKIESVSELSELDAVLEKNKEFLNSLEVVNYFYRSIMDEKDIVSIKQSLIDAIDKGLDVNADVDGDAGYKLSLLMATTAREKFDDISKLLIKRGADVNFKGPFGWTPLSEASQHGPVEIVKLLIEKGAEVNYRNTPRGRTALMLAAGKNKFEICKLLIEKGAEVNAKDDNGATALMIAANNGSFDVVKLLVKNGAETNAKDNQNRTALLKAVISNSSESVNVVEFLLKNGAKIDDKNKTLDLLHAAAIEGTLETFKFLIHKFNFNHKQYNDILLRLAALNDRRFSSVWQIMVENRFEKMDFLLKKGADINAKDEKGNTALIYAAQSGDEKLIRKLLDKGADINVRNKKKQTALDLAKETLKQGVPPQYSDSEEYLKVINILESKLREQSK